MKTQHPSRRWYQFRLSTILVLVAILAWGMALRPWLAFELQDFFPMGNQAGAGLSASWHGEGGPNATYEEGLIVWLYAFGGSARSANGLLIMAGPNNVAWPILALATFLAWKWIAARRKRRREQPTAT